MPLLYLGSLSTILRNQAFTDEKGLLRVLMDGLIGRESRIYGLTDADRMRDHYKRLLDVRGPLLRTPNTVLHEFLQRRPLLLFGDSGFLPLFRPCTPCRAYTDLPTVLAIVHLDGRHPIPPQYIHDRLHEGLRKAESTAVIRGQTGRRGLWHCLQKLRVPDYKSG